MRRTEKHNIVTTENAIIVEIYIILKNHNQFVKIKIPLLILYQKSVYKLCMGGNYGNHIRIPLVIVSQGRPSGN